MKLRLGIAVIILLLVAAGPVFPRPTATDLPTFSEWFTPMGQISLSQPLPTLVVATAALDGQLFSVTSAFTGYQFWRIDAGGTVAELLPSRGKAIGQAMFPTAVLAGPEGLVGVLDSKTYRITFLDPDTGAVRHTLTLSPLGIAPSSAVGDPARARVFVFASGAADGQEVRVMDYQNVLQARGGVFSADLQAARLTNYEGYQGALAPDGSLFYTSQPDYRIVRLAPDGTIRRIFADPGPRYVAPGAPPPEFDVNAPSMVPFPWREGASSIYRLVLTEDLVGVAYFSRAPNVTEVPITYLDLYTHSGTVVAQSVPVPPGLELMTCARDACYFISEDQQHVQTYQLKAPAEPKVPAPVYDYALYLFYSPTDCPAFTRELASWPGVIAAFADSPVAVVPVACFTNAAELAAFHRETGLALPARIDPRGGSLHAGGIQFTPHKRLVRLEGDQQVTLWEEGPVTTGNEGLIERIQAVLSQP